MFHNCALSVTHHSKLSVASFVCGHQVFYFGDICKSLFVVCINIFDKNKSWMWENNLMVWDNLTIEFLSSERTTADAGLSHFAKAEHCWNVAPRRPADFQRSDKYKSWMWENNLMVWDTLYIFSLRNQIIFKLTGQCSLSLDNTYHINFCYLIKINSMN